RRNRNRWRTNRKHDLHAKNRICPETGTVLPFRHSRISLHSPTCTLQRAPRVGHTALPWGAVGSVSDPWHGLRADGRHSATPSSVKTSRLWPSPVPAHAP